MASGNKRTYLREVNPHLICPLCRGYLIDATTVVECLHSFCRSCILKHLRKDAKCPSCKQLLNTAKPNIKADKALQDIVYKLVPGLYHKEMRKRREFYNKHPEAADSATPEQRGEDVTGRLIFAPEDAISLSLEYLPVGADPLILLANNTDADSNQTSDCNLKQQKLNGNVANRRYLQCPALVTIAHLKKFLALKYSVDVTRFNIDIYHRRAPLPEHWTLMDVAYIFAWKRNAPIRFFYRITEEQRLEAPPNDRPSTPGLGATQPTTNEQANEPKEKENPIPNHEDNVKKASNEITAIEPDVKVPSPLKRNDGEFLAKRTAPSPKEKSSTPISASKPEESAKQVKTPIKILKNSDGHYQVLRGSSANTQTKTPPEHRNSVAKTSPPTTPAEFSVVKIGDSTNSVKITLKQCSPGSNTSSSSVEKKKPKVISNVLLKNSNDKSETLSPSQETNKQEKKRKVSFIECPSINKQIKKQTEQPDKKQFLHSFRLTAKQTTVQQDPVEDANSVEAQVRNIIKNSMLNRELKAAGEESPKKQQTEVKTTSTNIAERLNDAKRLSNEGKIIQDVSSKTSDNQPQQPVDVYAFPNDPPSIVPPGAVKRKCPPGVPIFEMRKKQQQQTAGKRAGANTGKGTVKVYRGQTKPPLIFPKPSPVSRPLQSMPNPISNISNININNNLPSPTVTSTTSRNTSSAPSVAISRDTRSILDGCGLNIPASLSITLTAPRLSSLANNTQSEQNKESQKSLERLSPSITLNDKSVDPRVLKALKTGQMRMPLANAKTKGRQFAESQQGPPVKRKKDDALEPQLPKNILDLSGQKKQDLHPLIIPTPHGKLKAKPPVWSQANSAKPKDDPSNYINNSQVVTLNGGQRYYRAPPGSLTPAVNRINDFPTSSRAPVYAPLFSNTSSSMRPTPNLSSVFPSLQSLYALSQAPSLEQFHNMDSRMRMAATGAKDISPSISKSHLAAQCAPIKPARSSAGSFAVPIAKSSGLTIKPVLSSNIGEGCAKVAPAVSTAAESETTTTSSGKEDSGSEQKNENEDTKEAPKNTESEQTETIASSTEESSNTQQGAASPRVTSTASPSPPPPSEATAKSSKKTIDSEKSQPSSEVTSSNKSPESPDSSSVVTENNLVDSTKPAKSRESSPVKSENASEEQSKDVKSNDKDDGEFKKPITSEALQERLLAAFPSKEWANNPIAAEQFGNFLKSLSSMKAEAQSNNTKSLDSK